MINKIVAIACLVLFIGCVDYKEVQLISLENVSLNRISGDGIDADVWLKIDNPNDYKIKVNAKDLVLSFNDKKIGNATLPDDLVLEKSITKVYKTTLNVTVPPDGGIDLGLIMLMGGGQITLGLKGEITGKAKSISKTVPVDIKETISL